MLFSNDISKQNDIIIDNCLLTFKTHNNELICE